MHSFSALKRYTLVDCKVKREQAFSAMIFAERSLIKRGFNLILDNCEEAKHDWQLSVVFDNERVLRKGLQGLKENIQSQMGQR